MKKRIIISIILVLLSYSLVAEKQKVYSITRYKDLYDSLDSLYLELGIVPLSSSYPFTEAELENVIKQINPDKLSPQGEKLYNYVISKLTRNSNDKGFNGYFSGEVNVESYIQTDKDNDVWIYDYNSRKPLAEFDFSFGFNNHFWADLAIPLQKGMDFSNYSVAHEPDFKTYQSGAETNLTILWDQSQLDAQFPFIAVTSIGGDNWNILLGRDTLNYGVGSTGSLVLSKAGGYHDMLKASTFWNKFKYTFTLVNIDAIDLPGLEPYVEPSTIDNSDPANPVLVEGDTRKKQKVLINHTLEFKVLDNLSIALHEATIRGGGDLTLGYLNPLMIIHNLALTDKKFTVLGNSLFVLSANYTPVKRVNVYGEFALDQFETPSEADRQGENAGEGDPNAFGFLVGANYLHNYNMFSLKFNGEYVYTNPHLYRSQNSWSVYALTRWYHSVYNDSNDILVAPLGYEEGPDTQLVKLSVDGRFLEGDLDLTLEYYNILKGESRVEDRAEQGSEAADKTTPSGDTVFTQNIVSLMGNYQLTESISLYAQLHGLFFKNVDNIHGEDIIDFQIVLGGSYKF